MTWSLSAASLLVSMLCLSAGIATGLGFAAGGLALAGQAIFDLEPASAVVFLVVAPLAGCFPMAVLAVAARSRPVLAQRLVPGLGVWLLAAVTVTGWFGIRLLLT